MISCSHVGGNLCVENGTLLGKNVDIQETLQEFTGTATGPDPASQKPGTHPLTPLQETKDNIRRDNALFVNKTPVVCREIFSKIRDLITRGRWK